MLKATPVHLEYGRMNDAFFEQYGSKKDPMAGAFEILGPEGTILRIISSGHDKKHEWEHVSVSTHFRCPTWAEMCYVKDLFWLPSERVVQYHPPKHEYVNCHPYCLHLWRPMVEFLVSPPSHLVGPKDV